jgi:hypothetical protein
MRRAGSALIRSHGRAGRSERRESASGAWYGNGTGPSLLPLRPSSVGRRFSSSSPVVEHCRMGIENVIQRRAETASVFAAALGRQKHRNTEREREREKKQKKKNRGKTMSDRRRR